MLVGMTPPHAPDAPSPKTEKPKSDAKPKSDVRALRMLGPYLWPKGAIELRVRVVLAMLALIASNVATLLIPIVYGKAVDALSGKAASVIVLPVALIGAYGLARLLTQVFNEARTAIFQKVSQRAIRQIALAVFRHLHSLSLRFHLERQTGGLSRSIQRGPAGRSSLRPAPSSADRCHCSALAPTPLPCS